MNGMDYKITWKILDGIECDGIDDDDDDQNVLLRPQVCLDGGGVLQHLCSTESCHLPLVCRRHSPTFLKIAEMYLVSGRMWICVMCDVYVE
jgi:hypothetical protein